MQPYIQNTVLQQHVKLSRLLAPCKRSKNTPLHCSPEPVAPRPTHHLCTCHCSMCFMATGVVVSTLAGTPQALGVAPVAAPLAWPTPEELQAAGALVAAAAASQLALAQLAKQVGVQGLVEGLCVWGGECMGPQQHGSNMCGSGGQLLCRCATCAGRLLGSARLFVTAVA